MNLHIWEMCMTPVIPDITFLLLVKESMEHKVRNLTGRLGFFLNKINHIVEKEILFLGGNDLLKILISKKIEKIVHVLELIIAVLIILGIIVGLVDLVKYIIEIMKASPNDAYKLFQVFLGHVLVLIIGAEFVLMILYHSINSILELLLFVIAKKMLVYSSTMLDLVFGIVAIAIVFVIMKFLIPKNKDYIAIKGKVVYSASCDIKDILSQTKINIPDNKGRTIGDVVCNIAKEESRAIEKDAVFYAGDVTIKIVELGEDGTIEEVMIADNSEKKEEKKGFD